MGLESWGKRCSGFALYAMVSVFDAILKSLFVCAMMVKG